MVTLTQVSIIMGMVTYFCGYREILTLKIFFAQLKPAPTNIHSNALISMEKVGGHCDLISDQNHLDFAPWLDGPKRCLEVKYKWSTFYVNKTCGPWILTKKLCKCLLWPWKWSQGQMAPLWQKALSRMIIPPRQIGQYRSSEILLESVPFGIHVKLNFGL